MGKKTNVTGRTSTPVAVTSHAVRPHLNTVYFSTPLSLFNYQPKTYSYLDTQDFRRYHPLHEARPILNVHGTPARQGRRYVHNVRSQHRRYGPRLYTSLFPADMAKFSLPKKVLTCIRRKMRREVLFARGHGGARARRARPRYNERSFISCR